jgi:hypothetical protein
MADKDNPGATRRTLIAGMTVAGAGILTPAQAVADDGAPGEAPGERIAMAGAGIDHTAMINQAIGRLAARGGGTLRFDDADAPYLVTGTILLPSNIAIDLNSQQIRGRGSGGNILFVTAGFASDDRCPAGPARKLSGNLASPAEGCRVRNASVRNGRITECGRVFDLRNFNEGCFIENIATTNCRQFGRFERCFYAQITNVSAIGFSDAAIPTFHFAGQCNALLISRASATTAFAFLFEGGQAGITLRSCTAEGGKTAIKVKGDLLGVTIEGCYFEAITGSVFDLSEAGTCAISWRGNYLNYVACALDDGGANGGATLFGSWDSSNVVSNIDRAATARYRGRFLVSGPRNFIDFQLGGRHADQPGLPANWTVSPLTRMSFETAYGGQSLTDVRARNRVVAGIVPLLYGGDVGRPYPGRVPFSDVTIPTGAAVTMTIRTMIAWQPLALRASFILEIIDSGGTRRVFGDIFGDRVVNAHGGSPHVTARGEGGLLRLDIAGIGNASGTAQCTGTVRILG